MSSSDTIVKPPYFTYWTSNIMENVSNVQYKAMTLGYSRSKQPIRFLMWIFDLKAPT